MAVVFDASKTKSPPSSPTERRSVKLIRQLIPRLGKDGLFTSFLTLPRQICFETQESNEAVVLFLRQHPTVNLPWLTLALFLFFLPPLFDFFPPYQSLPTSYQFITTLSWYLLLFGFILAKFMHWFFNIFILTDERMIDIDFVNLFYRVISDAKIDKIQDVNSEMSGVWQTFFNYGSVFVQTAGETPQFVFQNIPHPDKVVQIINQLIDLEEQERLEGRVK